ncbi:hypothetical protein CEXT_663971 [Caerostris extrusa]|uniref:Uncharacterized protein n=1 Tax=Caerostris extrusa TaxID=172846 RepID=A0AAV4M627_CAEEX|nr:hypothetical protein CEXT_663971 [Caerostris extrusa]
MVPDEKFAHAPQTIAFRLQILPYPYELLSRMFEERKCVTYSLHTQKRLLSLCNQNPSVKKTVLLCSAIQWPCRVYLKTLLSVM